MLGHLNDGRKFSGAGAATMAVQQLGAEILGLLYTSCKMDNPGMAVAEIVGLGNRVIELEGVSRIVRRIARHLVTATEERRAVHRCLPGPGPMARRRYRLAVASLNIARVREALDRALIEAAYYKAGRCKREAARILRMDPKTYREKGKKLGVFDDADEAESADSEDGRGEEG